MIAISTEPSGHVAGLTEGVELVASASGIEEIAIGTLKALGSLNFDAVSITVSRWNLSTDHTFALVEGVSVIAAVAFAPS